MPSPKMNSQTTLDVSLVLVEEVHKLCRATISWLVATMRGKQQPDRREEMSLNNYALLQAYTLMGVTGLGYLALTWSTVVLLGGFVTSLGKKDFWCLTAISMVQAARIFNDLEDNLLPILLRVADSLFDKAVADPFEGIRNKWNEKRTFCGFMSALHTQLGVFLAELIMRILSMPALVAVLMTGVVHALGPLGCVAISLWRIWKRDYGNIKEDSNANLTPALNIFYSLVICQGAMFLLWWLIDYAAIWIAAAFLETCKLPEKWGSKTVVEYLTDLRRKCWRDPASVEDMNFKTYAVNLLNSEKPEDYLSGARILDTFIEQGLDVRSLLLLSRPKIQKLIDTVGRRSSEIEIRELAARIVAYLAGDIHLAQFPGSIQCISSLLDTTLPYWNNQQGRHHFSSPSKLGKTPQHQSLVRKFIKGYNDLLERTKLSKKSDISRKGKLIYLVEEEEKRNGNRRRKQKGDDQDTKVERVLEKGHGWNELILQGLTILERLASDQHNCRDICSNSFLLPKILAPIYTDTLDQDINIKEWADVVTGSLKVVHKLIRTPGRTGRRLRCEIASNKLAVSNLQAILDQDNKAGYELQTSALPYLLELQMHAMEILTELAFDPCTNLPMQGKEKLISRQLEIFLANGDDEKLKVTAGKTLALLCKQELSATGTITMCVMRDFNHIVDRLIEIIDAKNKIIYRTIAAEILENFCTHHTMDKALMKYILLPKVLEGVVTRNSPPEPSPTPATTCFPTLKEVLPCIKQPRTEGKPAPGDDEEKQLPELNGQVMSSDRGNEDQIATRKLQEQLLSLTWAAICGKLISEDDLDVVARKIARDESEFVSKLKTVVEENSHATPVCLRIVKLCGHIAVSMMGLNQYTEHSQNQNFVESISMMQPNLYIEHFQNQHFVESLSKASEIMANLESCMLFCGTDCGANKTVRPLLSEIEKELMEAVKSGLSPRISTLVLS